jgi:hypothetical protein
MRRFINVIPAKAGIQRQLRATQLLDSSVRWNDDQTISRL